MNTWIPLLTAIISAGAILIGYAYEKRKQREFDINKVRQEIYARYIRNIMTQVAMFECLRRNDKLPDKVTTENVGDVMMQIAVEHPDLDALQNEMREIMSLMSIYAPDQAVRACVGWYRESLEHIRSEAAPTPDLGRVIAQLRGIVLPKTEITPEEINLIISK